MREKAAIFVQYAKLLKAYKLTVIKTHREMSSSDVLIDKKYTLQCIKHTKASAFGILDDSNGTGDVNFVSIEFTLSEIIHDKCSKDCKQVETETETETRFD